MADDKKRDDFAVEMGERKGSAYEPPINSPRPAAPPPLAAAANNPVLPVLSYCGSSILMTVTNKFVLSKDFNLNMFLLAVQVSDYVELVENGLLTSFSQSFALLRFNCANHRT